ncbi:MAG: sigma-54 dependent transcriptional regulator [Polyangiales bacterium]
MAHVLMIDDDETFLAEQVRKALSSSRYRLSSAATGSAGLALVRADPPDVILLDLQLPDLTGLEVYEQIRSIDARIPVIFITMAKGADTAIEAMKRGAFNYLYKPLDLSRLQKAVDEGLEVAARMCAPVRIAEVDPERDEEGIMFGSCPAMLEVYKQIGRVAAQDITVLITGESGTGKELVARAIYQHSARARGPFMALNCAAIPEHLLESELFGHERGAFTGADRRRIGKFEQCTGGTILLDEIGDMPLALQAKVLRLLQEQRFQRVGGSETIQTDVRVIAATHRDLSPSSASDRFRPDLYFRLGVFAIHLPPLRERREDIPLLAEHYVRRFSRELGRDVRQVAPDALALLCAHAWPGNIRELQSVLKQALLSASGDVLVPRFLPKLVSGPVASEPDPATLEAMIDEHLARASGTLYADLHRLVDRMLFARVLAHTQGNHRAASRVLGIARQTMRAKLRAIDGDSALEAAEDEDVHA